MKVVGIRELKNRLSQYLHLVRAGQGILVTDRGEVIAELRIPGDGLLESALPYGIAELVKRGTLRLGAANEAAIYPALPCLLPKGKAMQLLDQERGNR